LPWAAAVAYANGLPPDLQVRASRFRLALPLLALVGTIAFASSVAQGVVSPVSFNWFDKAAHFGIYGLIATLAFRPLPWPLRSARRLLCALALALLLGATDEWIQSFNPAREASLLDWLADGLGGLAALALYRSCRPYRRLLELPLWGRPQLVE